MERFHFLDKSKLTELPKTSGVYCFKSKNEAIYIGKAINIQSRVKNHFNQPSYRDNLFIDKVEKVGYFETNSEIEALVLEANLIKKYQPKFNVVWRDDKNYFYVAFEPNKKGLLYVYITHQPSFAKASEGQGHKYIGPFIEGVALKMTLKLLRKVFPFYTQARHPKNKCMYCHLGLCPGPTPDLKFYKRNIKKLILILEGKRVTVLNSLKNEMATLSKLKKFEEAGKVRDEIGNLQQVMSHASVISQEKNAISQITLNKVLGIEKEIHRIECYDVSNIQGKQATGSMVVFTDGVADKSQYKKFKIRIENTPNDIAMLKEVLTRRFAHSEWPYAQVILIDGGKAQLNIAIKCRLAGVKVISIAKGRQELFIEGQTNPIPLKNLPQEIYNLIKNLDDEAHRFAIAYHRKLRKNELLK